MLDSNGTDRRECLLATVSVKIKEVFRQATVTLV